MKNKIILLAILLFATPLASHAYFYMPTANLTVNITTQAQDDNFSFNLKTHSLPDVIFYNYYQFNLQTENLIGSYSTEVSVSTGTDYFLQQENILGKNINNISCISDNLNDEFDYNSTGVFFNPIEGENIICTFNNIKSQSKTPVLFVPGIMGTELMKGSETLWADPVRMLASDLDIFMDPLIFNSDLTPSDSGVYKNDVLKNPSNLFDYTEGLANEFINQGYKENQDLFLFPYDWRYGVSGKYADGTTNVDLLKEEINKILQQTGADKIDVVAHSNGGLLIKKYVIDNPTSHHIGKAIFIGVPNTGAPKAVKALIQGDNMGVNFLGFGLSDSEMKKIAANMPAAYDLLPSQIYYDNAGSFVTLLDNTQGDPMGPFSISDQTKVTDLDYSQFKSFLTDEHYLNSTALNNAVNLHTQSFDNFDMRTTGVDLYAIDGCKSGTVANFQEATTKNLLGQTSTNYNSVEFQTGDGTVPIQSATNLPIDQDKKFYALSADHGKMPSENGIRQEIVNLISGSNLDKGKDIWGGDLITQDINKCELNGKAISVFSPVNIFVTDQNGNKLGLAEDGSVVNEIPGASFEIMSDPASAQGYGEASHKFLYLPQDAGQTYTINMQGTGTGTYTIKSQNIANSQPTTTEVFSNLPVTPALTGSINISSAITSLTVKQTPTDKTVTILPTSTLSAEASQDLIPPVSKIYLDGDQARNGVYKSNVEVKIKAKDKNSGVLTIQYSLDGVSFKKVAGDKVNFNVKQEGSHTITFFATDKAGNNEQIQTANFEIVKPKFLPKCKDDCKKDGWKKFGRIFRDQRDCDNFSDKKK